jgi:PAS domain S-box-containing protein
MSKPLSLLIVEDREPDAALLVRELRRGGYDLTYQRVDTQAAMVAAVNGKPWDIVLADYSLPKFDVHSALAALAELNLDIPLIVVTGSVGEEGAAEVMRAGAQDLVLKDNLKRLPAVVSRELEAAKTRRERRAADAKLDCERQLLNQLMRGIPDAICFKDLERRYIRLNDAERANLSTAREEDIIGRTSDMFVPADISQKRRAEEERVLATGETLVDCVEKIVGASGSARWLSATKAPIRGPDGAIVGIVEITRDVTEKRELERRLIQSQKMESVGQLTGGIAHDFNNILTVITGTIDILREGVADRPDLAEVAKLIDEAATRGADLTRQLLAFARKQPLQPQEIDINALVVESTNLLRPTLGEQVLIESRVEEGAWWALVDRSQLVTAILNLAINARDAMPGGGKLAIETGNVVLDEASAGGNADLRPGPYVMIAVSDTGTGIPAALRDKVFEPFFTTKDVGKGTGLGLSMVYGFIKQSGGHIKIDSEEGHGTTIRLYLPRAAGKAAPIVEAAAPAQQTGHERILVVEDDRLVRDHVLAQLQSLGYAVVPAANAAEALAILDRGLAPDLLFTDVVMPGGMNGRNLADQAKRRWPDLRVLFTSGYIETAIMDGGRLDPGVLLLAKPYRKGDLARMVRKALDIAVPAAASRA